MTSKKRAHLLVNFGGPRTLEEVEPFLKALLTDQDVVRTGMPKLLHNFLFSRIAKKRALKVSKDYQKIGGRSPIHADTEKLADLLRERLDTPLFTFHRYLPATHDHFASQMNQTSFDEICVLPLFPQFTYATTGSIARWFTKNLKGEVVNKMRWIKSYPAHSAFIKAHQNAIKGFITTNCLQEEECLFLFSAHGLPQKFVQEGDLYEDECQASFQAVMQAFPKALGQLAYQSKFGPGEWLRPYTSDVCSQITKYNESRKHVIVIPISFTSDHIETLFEIEEEYLPVIREKGIQAHRLPALNHREEWIEAILEILGEKQFCNTQMLVRH